jgi:hypothetical protein
VKTVTGYEPRFDFDVRRGKVGEELVGTILESMANASVEVKTDYGSVKTGNLYIEYEQAGRDQVWRPSGIATSQAEFWAFAFPTGAIFVRSETLREVCREVYKEGPQNVGYREGNENSSSSRGVKLPVWRLLQAMQVVGAPAD